MVELKSLILQIRDEVKRKLFRPKHKNNGSSLFVHKFRGELLIQEIIIKNYPEIYMELIRKSILKKIKICHALLRMQYESKKKFEHYLISQISLIEENFPG